MSLGVPGKSPLNYLRRNFVMFEWFQAPPPYERVPSCAEETRNDSSGQMFSDQPTCWSPFTIVRESTKKSPNALKIWEL